LQLQKDLGIVGWIFFFQAKNKLTTNTNKDSTRSLKVQHLF